MSYYFHVVHLTIEGKDCKPGESWRADVFIPLGTRAELHALIAKLFPESDFSDPCWIPVWYTIGDERLGMEILLDHDEPVKYLSLRHGSEEAGRIFYEATGWDVFDPNNERLAFDSE